MEHNQKEDEDPEHGLDISFHKMDRVLQRTAQHLPQKDSIYSARDDEQVLLLEEALGIRKKQ